MRGELREKNAVPPRLEAGAKWNHCSSRKQTKSAGIVDSGPVDLLDNKTAKQKKLNLESMRVASALLFVDLFVNAQTVVQGWHVACMILHMVWLLVQRDTESARTVRKRISGCTAWKLGLLHSNRTLQPSPTRHAFSGNFALTSIENR